MFKSLLFILLLVAFINPKLLKDIHFEVGVSVGPSGENTTENDTAKTTSETTPSSENTITVADTATTNVPQKNTLVADTATTNVPYENITQLNQDHSIFHELGMTKELISKLNLKDSKTREKLEKLLQARNNVQEDKSEIPVSQKSLSSNFIYTNSNFDFEDIINLILSIFM